MYQLPMLQLSRRDFLRAATTIGAVGCFGAHHAVAAAEPPLETTTIRLVHAPSICTAPQYIAEELLRLDGFTDVQYLPLGTRNGPYALADGRGDIAMWDTPGLIPHLDAGKPIVLLAGVHAGCYELFGQEEVRAIRDLKGKTVAIQYVGYGDHVLISSMLAYVGINPQHEVTWIAGESVHDAMDLFVAGKADAFLGFAQQPEELRLKHVGHVISLTPPRIGPGPSIFAAWWPLTVTSRSGTRSRQSTRCARSSRPPISARPIPRALRASSRTSCTSPASRSGSA